MKTLSQLAIATVIAAGVAMTPAFAADADAGAAAKPAHKAHKHHAVKKAHKKAHKAAKQS
jgi:hypothetical protein